MSMLTLQKGLRGGFRGLTTQGGEGVRSEGKAPAQVSCTLIKQVWVLDSLIRDNGCDVAAAESSSAC